MESPNIFCDISYINILAQKSISLDVSQNYFERFPYEVFGDYALKHLKISNCQMDDSKIIIYNNNLETLDLSKNRGNIIESIFETSQNLKKLNLKNISVLTPKLRNEPLEELYIEQINSIDKLNFPNLKIINLDASNSGTKQLINSKSNLSNLKKIIFRHYDNEISQKEIASTFPNAKIIIESFAEVKEIMD